MDTLDPIDALMLTGELVSSPMHVAALLIMTPPPGEDARTCVDRMHQESLTATEEIDPRLRRRPHRGVETGGMWVWRDVPDIDLSQHLQRRTLPAGSGSAADLWELVSELHAERLDRSAPMWTAHLIDGLDDGCILGRLDGCTVGCEEGCVVGCTLGCDDGWFDGCIDGWHDGIDDGWLDGRRDGCVLGRDDGWVLGCALGCFTHTLWATLGIGAVVLAGVTRRRHRQMAASQGGQRPPRRAKRAARTGRRGPAQPPALGSSEVAPLVDDLNSMIASNTEMLRRARTQAGTLAHALKTPLAILLDGDCPGIGLYQYGPHQALGPAVAGHDAVNGLTAIGLALPVQLHDGLHRHHQQQAEQQQQKDLVAEYLFDHDTSPC